jgi:hypothetical protein
VLLGHLLGDIYSKRWSQDSSAPVEAGHADPPILGHVHMMFLGHVLNLLQRENLIVWPQKAMLQ